MAGSDRPDSNNVAASLSGTSPSADEPQAKDSYPNGMSLALTLLSLALGTLLMALDTSIISVAVPWISTEFRSLDDAGWYGSAYLITLTAFQPITGNAYKMFDPKNVYLSFIVVFEVGSIVCATASTSAAFIVGRAVAGIGAAGLIQGALGIITYISPLEKRPLYMGIVISVFGICSSSGPVIGGLFTDRVSWRWCFWINVPIGGLVLGLVLLSMNLRGVDESTRQIALAQKLRRMDPIGILLLIGAVSSLFLALQYGGAEMPWRSAKVIGLFVGFGLTFAVFLVIQWKLGENATTPTRFLRQRTVAAGSAFLFCDNMSNYIKLYYLPFYFQAVLGTSAIQSGVNYIALAFPQLIGLLLSGGLVTRFGRYMPVILGGQVICAVGTGLLTTITTNTPTVAWAAFMVLVGIGLGLGINAPHIAIQAVMESDNDLFLANGVATFFSQLGGSIAISIGNAFLINGLNTEIPKQTDDVTPGAVIDAGPLGLQSLSPTSQILQKLREAYAEAIQHVMIFAAAMVIFTAIVPTTCGPTSTRAPGATKPTGAVSTAARQRDAARLNGLCAIKDRDSRVQEAGAAIHYPSGSDGLPAAKDFVKPCKRHYGVRSNPVAKTCTDIGCPAARQAVLRSRSAAAVRSGLRRAVEHAVFGAEGGLREES